MARKSSKRGFAAMDPKKQRQIASKGGRSSRSGGRVSSSSRTVSDRRSSSRLTRMS